MNIDIITRILMLFVLFFFSIYLCHKGIKKYSNILLVVYFVGQIQVIGVNTFSSIYHEGPVVRLLSYPVIFTWAPSFFMYINSLLFPSFRLRLKHAVHLLPAVFVFFYVYFSVPDWSDLYGGRMNEFDDFLKNAYYKFQTVFNIQIIGYNIAALIKYKMLHGNLSSSTPISEKRNLLWIKLSVFGFFSACMLTQLTIFFRKNAIYSEINWFFVSNLVFLVFFILLFYTAIVFPDIVILIQEKYRNSSLSIEKGKSLIKYLDEFMENSKLYCNPNITLKLLANETNIQERYLSQIINEFKGQNFFDYINTYRVETAMRLLRDTSNHNRTMLDILFDSGFNSKTTFNTAFKKFTGVTPSDYKKAQFIHSYEEQCV